MKDLINRYRMHIFNVLLKIYVYRMFQNLKFKSLFESLKQYFKTAITVYIYIYITVTVKGLR